MNNCSIHKMPVLHHCTSCRMGLCTRCRIVLLEGRYLCSACDQKIYSASGTPDDLTYKDQVENIAKWVKEYRMVMIIGVVIAIGLGIIAAPKGDSAMTVLLIPYMVGYLAIYFFYYFKVRCPKCRSYLLFYFGESFWETTRFKHCTRCGLSLRRPS